jgi:acetyltransferase-like isoleucine patch superfamily enzyme
MRILNKQTTPIPFGLWILNFICQRLLDINNDLPWMIHFTSRVIGDIHIGKNVDRSFALSGHCYMQGLNGIYIGDNTIFAPGVKIISSNHDTQNLDIHLVGQSVRIGPECWIGTNAVILPGVTLGRGVVVGAGAVVNRSFPDNSVICGIPAKLVKMK